MCVRESVCARVSVWVCGRACERVKERNRGYVCVCIRMCLNTSVCLFVRAREKDSVSVRACMCLKVCTCLSSFSTHDDIKVGRCRSA